MFPIASWAMTSCALDRLLPLVSPWFERLFRPLQSSGLCLTKLSHFPPVLAPHQCHVLLFQDMVLDGSSGSLSNQAGFGFISLTRSLGCFPPLSVGFLALSLLDILFTCAVRTMIFSSSGVGAFHVPLSLRRSYFCQAHSISWL